MAMNGTYLNAVGDAGAALITHIGLTDGGVELSGGSPAYARQAVSWTAASNGADPDGTVRPTANLEFNVPAGATVDGWVAYSASTGGTAYGGEALTAEAFGSQGLFTLNAASTAINHQAA